MMIKKLLTVSAVTAMLLLTGCENDAEDRMSTQVMLDSGDYDGVISALEDKNNKTDDDVLKLASAYMDKSGFSVTDLVSIAASAEDDTKSSFASFVTEVNENKTDDALENLQKAIDNYTLLVDTSELSKAPHRSESLNEYTDTLDSNELFLGMAYIAKVATVLSYLGDVTKLEEEGTDGNIVASGCALTDIYTNLELPKECASVNYSGPITINDYEYQKIDVILNGDGGNTYHLLANQNRTDLILTDYNSNFNNTGYPFPTKDESSTVLGELLDTLNSAFNFIIDTAPDDIKNDVDSYRNEIDSNRNNDISISELTNYLNAEMAKN